MHGMHIAMDVCNSGCHMEPRKNTGSNDLDLETGIWIQGEILEGNVRIGTSINDPVHVKDPEQDTLFGPC